MLATAAIAALSLIVVCFALRVWVLRHRRARPLALIVADAIAQGSVHDMSGTDVEMPGEKSVDVAATGKARLRLSAYRKLDGNEDNWGFSIHEADNLVATFVYPGADEARAAHKAMRRAFKDLNLLLQPVAQAPVRRAEADAADFRPERPWAGQSESVPEFGRRASAQL